MQRSILYMLLALVVAGFTLPTAAVSQATASELAGTSWQLVEISSMDDSTDVPDDPSRYTLELGADGSVSILADCNRGMGSWSSEGSSRLTFGPLATTRAMCPPGSLSDTYVAQFEYVRSYVLKDGHLFLATMADGSIIEFEPLLLPLAATVLGEEIRTSEADEMKQILLTRLFDRYAEEHDVAVSESEIEAYLQAMKQGMAAEGLNAEEDLTPEEVVEVKAMREEMARSIIWQWKLNRKLYHQYGGRVIYQQFGPEPLDAYRQYLEERQAAGDFKIENPAFEVEFWRYFKDESIHSFFEPGTEESAFVKPPWGA